MFTRLWKRDNKPHYRRFQPRMWGLLERDLARPGLEPLRDWFDGNVAPRTIGAIRGATPHEPGPPGLAAPGRGSRPRFRTPR